MYLRYETTAFQFSAALRTRQTYIHHTTHTHTHTHTHTRTTHKHLSHCKRCVFVYRICICMILRTRYVEFHAELTCSTIFESFENLIRNKMYLFSWNYSDPSMIHLEQWNYSVPPMGLDFSWINYDPSMGFYGTPTREFGCGRKSRVEVSPLKIAKRCKICGEFE